MIIVKPKHPQSVLHNCQTSDFFFPLMWKMSFCVGVYSPLLVSSGPLPSYNVITYISLLLFCSCIKYLSYIIYFCPCFTGTGIPEIWYFYLCTLFLSSPSAAPDTLLFPFPSLSLFCKGLSCVLSPNPFKIPCAFLNDSNLLTRQGDENAGSLIRRTC